MTGTVSKWQKRCWSFYGFPGLTNSRPVGEVHYVNSWLSDQMTRLEWDVLIDGSEVWTVTDVPGQDTPISTTRPVVDPKEGEPTTEENLTEASTELLNLIDWDDTNVRSITTNLFVAGQGDYIFDGKNEQWRVVSVVEKDRQDTIKKATERVPFIWPHPADNSLPDAPLFSVLELLEELDWLNRQSRTQSSQRVLVSGILGTADGFVGPNGEDNFWDQWNTNLSARMVNPEDMSPIRLKGPLDLIREGINWVVPDFGYDDVLDRKILACINRLAYGLPVPPEILLGMQAQSRATAFQVEENAYRAHIEPPAHLVAQVAEDALTEILDGVEVRVIPNPAKLLARRNSVEDTKWAFKEGLADGSYTREVLNVPEDAAPEAPIQQSQSVIAALDLVKALPSLARNPGISVIADQIAQLLGGDSAPVLDDSVADVEQDPANAAADEPITAAAIANDLASLLSDIDFHLSSELAGATAMATDRARQRLGGAARVNQTVRDNKDWKKLSNAVISGRLGVDGLTNAGVDVAAQITEPIESVAAWWSGRVADAWAQTAALIPGWSGQPGWVSDSSALLVEAMTAHVVDTLDQYPTPSLDAEQIRLVVDAAAGGS